MVGKQPGAMKSSRSPNPPIVWRCFHRRFNCEGAGKSHNRFDSAAETLSPNTYQVAPSQFRFPSERFLLLRELTLVQRAFQSSLD